LSLQDVDARSWFADTNITTIPGTVGPVGDQPPIGLSSSYSLTSQGFTADVTCEFKNLALDTTPSLYLVNTTPVSSIWPAGSDFSRVQRLAGANYQHRLEDNARRYPRLQNLIDCMYVQPIFSVFFASTPALQRISSYLM
jgi:hypothetical protein